MVLKAGEIGESGKMKNNNVNMVHLGYSKKEATSVRFRKRNEY